MLNKVRLVLLSIIFFHNAYAMHCPLPAELHHINGHAWTVDSKYTSEGWTIWSDSAANISTWTTIPDEFPLYVQLYPDNTGLDKANCLYSGIPEYGSGNVVLANKNPIMISTIAIPPFVQNSTATLGFRCDVTAVNAASCHWN